jgi:hypothetical protein
MSETNIEEEKNQEPLNEVRKKQENIINAINELVIEQSKQRAESNNEQSSNTQSTETTPTTTPTQKPTKPSYSPNKAFMSKLIDKVIEFIEDGKKVENEIKTALGTDVNIADITDKQMDELITRVPGKRSILEKYKVMKKNFEKVEQDMLIEASKQFGFEKRDYFITPLKELIEKIKKQKGKIDIAEVTTYLERLAKLIAINTAIDKLPIIPYVGPVINGIIEGLDNYSSTKDTINKFLDMLQKFGIDKCDLDQIRSYTKDTFFTRRYELFKEWLVAGANFDMMYPFSIFGKIREQFWEDVGTFLNNYHKENGKIIWDNAKSDMINAINYVSTAEKLLKEKMGDNKIDKILDQLKKILEDNKNTKLTDQVVSLIKKMGEKYSQPSAPSTTTPTPSTTPSTPTPTPTTPSTTPSTPTTPTPTPTTPSTTPTPTPTPTTPTPTTPSTTPTPTPTPTTPTPSTTTPVGKSQSGGFADWTPIGFVKPKINKKTRRSIHKINRTIKSYLSRLRRTRRKPFGKSVATLNVKRRF